MAAAEKRISEGYDYAICLFDLDKIISDGLVEDWLRKCRKAPREIIPICSNPCIEIWFLQHLVTGYSGRFYESYEQVLSELKKYEARYDKSERFFVSSRFFENIDGFVLDATMKAERLMGSVTPDNYRYSSFSEVYKTIAFLEKCRSCDSGRSCSGCLKSLKEGLLVTRLLKK